MTATRIVAATGALPRAWRTLLRAGVIVLITLLQLSILDRNFELGRAVQTPAPQLWVAVNLALKWIAYTALFGTLAFTLTAAAQRWRVLEAAWLNTQPMHAWGRWLVAQCVLFAALVLALPLFQTAHSAPPWAAFLTFIAGIAAMCACAAFAFAPLKFWRAFAAQSTLDYVIALAFGAFALAAFALSGDSWDVLSALTLQTAFAVLQLYEPNAFMELEQRILGIGDFRVAIYGPCSGYEGIALVLGMLGFYLFAFRRDLRFPHVLALLPIGVAAIWLSNALRIAILVSLGAHVSPDVALNGFHAQAGWVMFLAVTLTLMLVAHHMPVFRRHAATLAQSERPAVTLASALLIPFAALMAARAIASMFGTENHWPSVTLIALPAAAIWLYRKPLLAQLQRIGWEPWLVGILVGVLWIATEPPRTDTLGPWLAAQPEAAGLAWTLLRIFGFAIIVPIAEELVFRGYLHRALVKRRFEEAAPGAFTWIAFLATSLLFGAMHGRWLAGALAGAAFALTLYRSKTIGGPIAAHVAANGLIAAYAVALQDWALL